MSVINNPLTQRQRIEALEAWRAKAEPLWAALDIWRATVEPWQVELLARLAGADQRAAAFEAAAAADCQVVAALAERLAALELRVAAIDGPVPEPEPAPPGPPPGPEPTTPGQPMVGLAPLEQCPRHEAPRQIAGAVTLTEDAAFATDAFQATGDVTLDLAGHTVYFGTGGGNNCCGLRSESYEVGRVELRGPGFLVLAGDQDSAGAADRAECHAVHVPRGRDGLTVAVSDVALATGGRDAACVRVPYGTVSLTRVLGVCRQTSTADRHARPANVWCPQASLTAEQCVLLGGNSGIVAAHNHATAGGRSTVRRCLVSVEQFATNGYAVSGAVVEDCLLASPTSGRGVLFESPYCALRRCVVLAWDRPNAEFGDPLQLDAPGVRIRHYGPEPRNHAYGCVIEGNQVLSIGGGEHCQAAALMLSTRPAANGAGVAVEQQYQTVRRNWFAAMRLAGGVPGVRCRAVSLESQGFWPNPEGKELADYGLPRGPGLPARDWIADNEFASNQFLLSTTGSDNATGCWQERALENNAWGWTDGRSARSRWIEAARAKLAEMGLEKHPNAVARLAAIEQALAVLDAAELLPPGPSAGPQAGSERYTWSTGLYGPGEQAVLTGSTTAPGSLAPVTWTAADASPSERSTERVLVVEGAEVRAR